MNRKLVAVLQETGQSELNAWKIADAIQDTQTSTFSTKADLLETKLELKNDIHDVRLGLSNIKLELKQDISDIRSELKDLEVKLVRQYNINSIVLAVLTIASALSQFLKH